MMIMEYHVDHHRGARITEFRTINEPQSKVMVEEGYCSPVDDTISIYFVHFTIFCGSAFTAIQYSLRSRLSTQMHSSWTFYPWDCQRPSRKAISMSPYS